MVNPTIMGIPLAFRLENRLPTIRQIALFMIFKASFFHGVSNCFSLSSNVFSGFFPFSLRSFILKLLITLSSRNIVYRTRICKECLQREIILLANLVRLMIVASCATRGSAQQSQAYCIGHVSSNLIFSLNQITGVFVVWKAAQKASSN